MHRFRLMAAIGCLLTAAVSSSSRVALAELRHQRRAGELTDVSVTLEVGGVLKLPGEKSQKLAMKVTGSLKYQERLLEVTSRQRPAANGQDDEPGGKVIRRSIRHYDQVDAELTVGSRTVRPKLRQDRTLIGASIREGRTTLFSPKGSLTRDELDLLYLPGDSLCNDLLVPKRLPGRGAPWKHDNATITLLLGLDSVVNHDVASTVTESNGRYLTIELAGTVHGTTNGVATELDVKGRYYYDHRYKRLSSLQLVIKENREAGYVSPGVEAVAKIKIQINPRTSAPALSNKALSGITLEPQTQLTRLAYQSDVGHFRILHDRDWYVTSDDRHAAVLRRLDEGKLIAQCNLIGMPALKKGHEITLAKFQGDIRTTLKKNFGSFVQASEKKDARGRLVYRVEAAGKVDGLPVRWLYYLVSRPDGGRVTAVFTMEDAMLKQFASADAQIIRSLDILTPATPAESSETKPAASQAKASGAKATKR